MIVSNLEWKILQFLLIHTFQKRRLAAPYTVEPKHIEGNKQKPPWSLTFG